MIKGISLSLLASTLFGSMYYYTTQLEPLSGEEVFGWRMVLTLPVMTIFLLLTRDWHLVKTIAKRVLNEPSLPLALLASSLLLGVQLWLFLWAPLHGHALNVSLGYFMMPLTMVLIGRVYYKERLSKYQMVAVGLALIGVGNAVLQAGGFAWTSLLVCLGYPYYFVLRTQFKTDNLGGLWFDMAVMAPLALYFAMSGAGLNQMLGLNSTLPLLVLGLGLLSASALIAYILSSKLLPFSLFGLLGYAEPVLLVGVAFLIGEAISPSEWPTYVAIWLALGVLALEGVIGVAKKKSRPIGPNGN